MIVICGGGILGLSIARKLLEKGADEITIIEKEKDLGVHASGRNSGVLHAGIYYTPDSLKARFCLKGNLLMREYCKEKGIPILETGKVIVTKSESEIQVLKELYNRALRNGARVELVDESGVKEIEPYARTVELALYSPLTAVVNPIKILEAIEKELTESGKVKILKGVKFEKLKSSKEILTNRGSLRFETFINCGGAYADRIAHEFGVGLKYRIIPFKGTYKKLKKEKRYLVRGNIYPVPDIRNPFLGVHFTKSYNGDVYIGPTAIPALGRENYGLLRDIDREALKILWQDAYLFFVNEKFRNVALTEPRKYLDRFFFKDIEPMVEGLSIEDIEPSDKVGIRPQLVDWEKKELVMDFLVIKEGNSVHILNAISPAFTSAFAFSEYVVNNYILQEVRRNAL
ncbi:L-2-hydroxyglutarate oxidase [Thermosulfurimonas marina]|uniref:L-2-hydroxyglutarate oxidase n=1 Tax=Thermosulfurimonas marina TaxID=2047767 RepID=A0A6H1WRT5_9BACT|nr:L-2-hydroxyglutarate oxidase [Thermosulfurimonas marina]QJA05891.1 L-2-hydroxyglutarate oxidase [Thermosulfurimonas marina]